MQHRPMRFAVAALLAVAVYDSRAAGSDYGSALGAWWGGFGTPTDHGLVDAVSCFVEYRGELVAGGHFVQASGLNALARWDGSNWQSVGDGVLEHGPGDPLPCDVTCAPTVTAAVAYGDDLVVAGRFRYAGGWRLENRVSPNIAQWNGSRWSSLGRGFDNFVRGLCVWHGRIVAYGPFTWVNGVPAARAACWDGNSWSSLEQGLLGPIESMQVLGEDLYALTGRPTGGGRLLVRWNGNVWEQASASDFGSSLLGVFDSALLAFPLDDLGTAHVSTLQQGDLWQPIGDPGDAVIPATRSCTLDDRLYLGGFMPGLDHIAEWDGKRWNRLGSGLGPGISPGAAEHVLALHIFGGRLFVGGHFVGAGSEPSWHVARWDPAVTGLAISELSAVASNGSVWLRWLLDIRGFEALASVVIERRPACSGVEWTILASLEPRRDMQWIDQNPLFDPAIYRVTVWSDNAILAATTVVSEAISRREFPGHLQALEAADGRAMIFRWQGGGPAGVATLNVYCPSGRTILSRTVDVAPGSHEWTWGKVDGRGIPITRGVYIAQLSTRGAASVKKFVVTRATR